MGGASVNNTVQTVDQIIQNSVFNAALPIAEAAIEAELPFLALPGVNAAFNLLMEYVATKLYDSLAEFATIVIIDEQTGNEESAYSKAEGVLRAAHLKGDANAIAEASKNLDSAIDDLVHWDATL